MQQKMEGQHNFIRNRRKNHHIIFFLKKFVFPANFFEFHDAAEAALGD
jgi:hypothetical protein